MWSSRSCTWAICSLATMRITQALSCSTQVVTAVNCQSPLTGETKGLSPVWRTRWLSIQISGWWLWWPYIRVAGWHGSIQKCSCADSYFTLLGAGSVWCQLCLQCNGSSWGSLGSGQRQAHSSQWTEHHRLLKYEILCSNNCLLLHYTKFGSVLHYVHFLILSSLLWQPRMQWWQYV